MECPECGKNFYGMQMMIQNVSVIFAASLICDFCPSDQSFAYSFLQIPSHDGHPYCSAIHFPLSGRVRDLHPLERAHGAQTKGMSGGNSNPRRLCAVALGRNAVSSRWLRAAPPTCASNACVCRCVGAYYTAGSRKLQIDASKIFKKF